MDKIGSTADEPERGLLVGKEMGAFRLKFRQGNYAVKNPGFAWSEVVNHIRSYSVCCKCSLAARRNEYHE